MANTDCCTLCVKLILKIKMKKTIILAYFNYLLSVDSREKTKSFQHMSMLPAIAHSLEIAENGILRKTSPSPTHFNILPLANERKV